MQATEIFYNVLWWSKNARQYRQDDELDHESSGNPHPRVPPGSSSWKERQCQCLRMLHRYLLPIVCKIHDTIWDPLFQQDNAPIHKAGRVMTFFENHNINLLTHPPYSPDLNPIEYAWVLLKRQLIDYPDIGDTPGGPPAVKARLAQVLPRVWDNIPRKHFEAL